MAWCLITGIALPLPYKYVWLLCAVMTKLKYINMSKSVIPLCSWQGERFEIFTAVKIHSPSLLGCEAV
jgi:hypothetical protein